MFDTKEIWSREALVLILDAYLNRKAQSLLERRRRVQERQVYLSQPKTKGWIAERNQLALQFFWEPVTKEYIPTASNMVLGLIELRDTINQLTSLSDPNSSHNHTLNCISRKLFAFSTIDPDYRNLGIQAASVEILQLWDEFNADRKRLHALADVIKLTIKESSLSSLTFNEDGEGVEGGLQLHLHLTRERDKTLVSKKKKQTLKRYGILACEACGFVFSRKYGSLGEGFIECHHTVPISRMTANGVTRLKDLALVCSNCHRMLHRSKELLTIERLRSIIISASL